ncbi:hypothetical protein OBBRIDRAFT_885130 [Obba rivulosa]|uniref:Uncharacterized protein n=1 Tax=Obba rivulosa TaxID=1052685 RepID=A0A8E2DQG2_9APHY|nr:hypothetical protein OBBRIDRAFT_885130 [Obba rivulosa]
MAPTASSPEVDLDELVAALDPLVISDVKYTIEDSDRLDILRANLDPVTKFGDIRHELGFASSIATSASRTHPEDLRAAAKWSLPDPGTPSQIDGSVGGNKQDVLHNVRKHILFIRDKYFISVKQWLRNPGEILVDKKWFDELAPYAVDDDHASLSNAQSGLFAAQVGASANEWTILAAYPYVKYVDAAKRLEWHLENTVVATYSLPDPAEKKLTEAELHCMWTAIMAIREHKDRLDKKFKLVKKHNPQLFKFLWDNALEQHRAMKSIEEARKEIVAINNKYKPKSRKGTPRGGTPRGGTPRGGTPRGGTPRRGRSGRATPSLASGD